MAKQAYYLISVPVTEDLTVLGPPKVLAGSTSRKLGRAAYRLFAKDPDRIDNETIIKPERAEDAQVGVIAGLLDEVEVLETSGQPVPETPEPTPEQATSLARISDMVAFD